MQLSSNNPRQRTRILARSSDDYVIYPAKIHDPTDLITQAWIDTGNALREAMADTHINQHSNSTKKDLHYD